MKTSMTRAITMAVLLLAALCLRADDKAITVAVYNITVTSTAENVRQIGPKLTSLVTAELSTDPRFVLVERAQLSKALKEQALGVSGVVDREAAAKVGHLTGAKILVAGHGFKPTGDKKFIVVMNVIGTESGRLFVERIDSTADKVTQMADEITRRVANVITTQRTNLIIDAPQQQAIRIDDIIKMATGPRRPSVAINVRNAGRHVPAIEYELGMVFYRAGFPVVNDDSEDKPEITITGDAAYSHSSAPQHMSTCQVVFAAEAKEAATGKVLLMDQIKVAATDAGKIPSQKAALANAADTLAMKLLPLLSADPAGKKK